MDRLTTTKDRTAMDESHSPLATAATPPTHTPGSTTPRHGHCGHRPIQPTCPIQPRTMTTCHGPNLGGPTDETHLLLGAVASSPTRSDLQTRPDQFPMVPMARGATSDNNTDQTSLRTSRPDQFTNQFTMARGRPRLIFPMRIRRWLVRRRQPGPTRPYPTRSHQTQSNPTRQSH